MRGRIIVVWFGGRGSSCLYAWGMEEFVVSRPAVSQVLSTTGVISIISRFIALQGQNVGCMKLYPFRDSGSPSFCISPTGGVYGYFTYNRKNATIRFVVGRRRLSCCSTLHFLTGGCGVRVRRQRLSRHRGRIHDSHRDVLVIGD